jgi:hypothetical protein
MTQKSFSEEIGRDIVRCLNLAKGDTVQLRRAESLPNYLLVIKLDTDNSTARGREKWDDALAANLEPRERVGRVDPSPAPTPQTPKPFPKASAHGNKYTR